MGHVSLVIGQAGTGKTTWLIEKVKERAPLLVSSENQRVLGITRMHGARRRVQNKLNESCAEIPCSVATVDGFALSILNRWRTALGWTKPIQSVNGQADFAETVFGIDADFEKVLLNATRLLESNTVRRILNASYPLIAIDEFQDCHGALLEFIKALSLCSSLLLAADDFQLLDTSTTGCPAVEWVQGLHEGGSADTTELTEFHRTTVTGILNAARCLRENLRSNVRTVPVICCPKAPPAAWKIIEAIVLRHPRWTGNTALICPGNDPFISKVLDSCDSQLRKRGLRPLQWHVECAIEEEQQSICKNLGLTATNDTSECRWISPTECLDPIGAHALERSHRFARLKGVSPIPSAIVRRHIETLVHEKHAYGSYNHPRCVTTVHGAKNREFDNVFVLWTYKLPPDKVQQRRLLYNAITRARNNCMVLVLGDTDRANSDSVLNLLGPPQPAFQVTKKSKKGRAKKAAGPKIEE